MSDRGRKFLRENQDLAREASAELMRRTLSRSSRSLEPGETVAGFLRVVANPFTVSRRHVKKKRK